jgi:4-amino-4-deoxychorismate lyase
MCRLLETIKIKNGKLHNINLHNERLNRSRQELFGINDKIDLENEIHLQENTLNGISKCRIVYSKFIEEIDIIPYQFRKIGSLKIVENNEIKYTYKYYDRYFINQLYALREKCDDILIINNGRVTDTSYCNIVFSDGKKLLTSFMPLLKGIKREQLLNEGIIIEEDIKRKDIHLFKKVFLINAMIDLDDKMEILTSKII